MGGYGMQVLKGSARLATKPRSAWRRSLNGTEYKTTGGQRS
jgi:hypothetical protein